MKAAGERGWVVLTKDAAIRANQIERAVIMSAGVAAFMLGRGNLSGEQMANVFLAAMPRVKRALRRFHVPFIASITVAGSTTVLFDRQGRLKKPIVLK